MQEAMAVFSIGGRYWLERAAGSVCSHSRLSLQNRRLMLTHLALGIPNSALITKPAPNPLSRFSVPEE